MRADDKTAGNVVGVICLVAASLIAGTLILKGGNGTVQEQDSAAVVAFADLPGAVVELDGVPYRVVLGLRNDNVMSWTLRQLEPEEKEKLVQQKETK